MPRTGSSTARWRVAAWALVCLGAAAALQAYGGAPSDPDTAYHVAVGQLIRTHGILHAFPWTPFSVLADHYADKELLFHLLFVPLSGVDWITAAKIVGALTGGATLLALYLVLRSEGVGLAGAWALLPLAASGAFVFRFALVRPHVPSIGLAIVALWAAARGRLLVLAIVTALYPWVHISWHLPIALAVVAEAARMLSGERPRWQPLATVLAALAVGLLVHPNTVNLVRFNWLVLVDVLARNVWQDRAGFAMGNEFRAFSPVQVLRYAIIPAAVFVAAAALAWRRRREGCVPLAFALAALGFALLTARSARFIELFTPFSVAALALALPVTRWRPLPAALLGAAALYTGTVGAGAIRNLARAEPLLPQDVAQQLAREVPEGAQVFNCDWEATGELMLALPDRRFIVALDPTLLHAGDPERYDLWYRLPREAPPGSAPVIRNAFGARAVLCRGRQWRPFYRQLASEPGVNTTFVSQGWTLIDLGGAPAL